MVALTNALAFHARTAPESTALVFEDRRVSYRELLARAQRAAGLIRARGAGPGDVVALLMKNSAAFVELALAASHAGAVLLPINFRLAADEVAYILEHAGAKLLFVDDELSGSASGFGNAIVLDARARTDTAFLACDAAPFPDPHPATPETLFRLMYTSGTTDRPKGVMHTYGNYHWKCLDHLVALGLSRDERLLVVGPLYHVGAFDLPGLAVLMAGGMLCVLRDFDPEPVLRTIDEERITGAWMAPVMLNRLLAEPGRDRFRRTSLRWLIGGGERTPAERIRAFGSLFPAGRYVDAYGLTETCSGDTMMEPGREIEKIGSTGRALAHVEVEIRDDAGRALPAGETGEVCLRGPKVTSGYWRDPAKTAASFFGEWFRTGDVGHLDDEGFLYLTDRKKDMIISGGENVASSEVERVLYELPQVGEAAAIGLPDERWGERVVAVLVLRDGASLDAAEVERHCRARLGGFKAPKQVIFADALPRNPSGKVLKRVMRERYAQA